jgi:metal-sulfur cluster biosynthetic enzyme
MICATGEELAARIEDALRLVIDPELGCNIVDLGLVYGVTVSEQGESWLVMTTTTRGCPATAYLKEGAENAARDVEGIRSVEITLTYDPAWNPDMMNASAKQQLGF